MKRGGPIRRKTALRKRAKRLPSVNRKRKGERWERAYHSVAFVEFTRMSPSSATGERGPCVCSHSAKSRAAGGTARDVVPLTPEEHAYEHLVGVETAWSWWGKDPKVEAEEHWQRYVAYMEAWG